MLYRILLIIFLALLNFVELYACNCLGGTYDSIQKRSLKNADLVFYGELINIDTITYKYSFRIYEIFKGEFKEDTIYGKSTSSCSLYDFDKGLWIVYATFNDDSTINISSCGASRSITNPVMMLYPPPPASRSRGNLTEIEKLKFKIVLLEINQRATTDWFIELENLRNLKKQVGSKVNSP
jgi:hypothetical protein